MSLLTFIVILVVLAIFWYAADRWLPGVIRTVAKVVIAVIAIYYLLLAFGLLDTFKSLQVPKL